MAIHNFWLSSEITWGKILETKNIVSIEEIARKLSTWTHHITSPDEAFDIISSILPNLEANGNIEFYLWVLYVIWEYLNWGDTYNENNTEWYYHIQNAVNSVRNRKWIISKQVAQILDPFHKDIICIETNFKWLSQAITNFVVTTNSREERRKMQAIKNVLLKKLWLSEQTDWTVILSSIETIVRESKQQKEAA